MAFPKDPGPSERNRSLLALAARLILGFACLLWSDAAIAADTDRGDVYLTGSLSASLSFYDATGRPGAHESTSWTFRGAPLLHLYGLEVPFTLTVTEQDRAFRQPLNRLGAHPRMGWAVGHLGYSSLNWSPYSLGGQTILGVGLEGKPGKVDFGVLAGRMRRAVEPDSIAGIGRVAPVYRRTGFALRGGMGDDAHRVTLIAVRGADDENSLSIVPSPTTVTPAENFVVSAVGHWGFSEAVALDCEWAQSAWTDDKLGARDGKYAKVLLKAFGFLMDRRASTRESQALSAKLGWTTENGGVDLSYKRIDPGYRSMGAYYFNGDLENITIEPTLKLANGRMRMAGSLGFQHDNLSDGKEVETTRTIGSGRVDWTPGSIYTANASYSNYSLDQKAGRSPLDSTSVKIAQSTSNLGLTQSLSLVGQSVAQNAVVVWSRQDMEDRTVNGSLDASYTAHQFDANYTFTWIPWGLAVNAGFHRSIYDVAGTETKVTGPQLGANLSLWQNKATLGAGGSLSTTSLDGDEAISTRIIQIQAALRPRRRHNITARFSVHHDEARTPTGTDDTETRGEIGYAYSF